MAVGLPFRLLNLLVKTNYFPNTEFRFSISNFSKN